MTIQRPEDIINIRDTSHAFIMCRYSVARLFVVLAVGTCSRIFQKENAKATLHRLELMFGRDSKSNCSGAVDMDVLMKMRAPAINNRLQLPFRKDEQVSHYINFGAGTTGTRFLFTIMCNEFHVSGTHYAAYCRGEDVSRKEQTIPSWYESIKSHAKTGNPVRSTLEKRVLSNLVKQMLLEHHGGSYWTDTPVSEIFMDLIGLRPWKFVMATYRNPSEWAARRLAEHNQGLICHPSLWDSPVVFHPFDIIGCLEARDFVKDAFLPIKQISSTNLERAFIKMNTRNAYEALHRNIPFLPICVFDSNQNSVEAVLSLLRQSGMKPDKW